MSQNIVCYEAKIASDGKTIDTETPLDAYWLDIDPEYTKKRRAKGDMTDRVELGAIERRMCYGCVSQHVSHTTRGDVVADASATPLQVFHQACRESWRVPGVADSLP